jgi:hypothetical protein
LVTNEQIRKFLVTGYRPILMFSDRTSDLIFLKKHKIWRAAARPQSREVVAPPMGSGLDNSDRA